MCGGGSSGGSQTVTQVQQIPEWQQGYAKENEQIAASLASRPYQQYQGQMIAGFTPDQQAGINMSNQAATAYQPYINNAGAMTDQAATVADPYRQISAQLTGQGAQTWGQASPEQQAAYMNPYVMQSLSPQLQQLALSQAQNQKNINAQATQAGAYGDARHGVAQSLNDFYGNLERSDLIGQGYNNAYNTGMQAYATGQQQQLAAGQQFNAMGNDAQANALNAAKAYSTLGQQAQDQGLAGGSAMFQNGTQQQQLNQQQLTLAYNNFMNQVNYPTEQLNMRIAALANSPYTVSNQTSLAPSNATAMNLGAFGALAGGLGSLASGSGGSGLSGIFGGGA